MTVKDVMFGSVVNYLTPEGHRMPIVLNEQHLNWLVTDEEGFNLVHERIIPDEEILLKIGFRKGYRWFTICLKHSRVLLEVSPCSPYAILNGKYYELKFLDEIQMLFKVLEKTELDLKFLIE